MVPHLKSLGVHITAETQHPEYRSAFVHHASANGAFLEIIEATGGGSASAAWPPAGPRWVGREWHPLTRQLRQAAILVRDLDQAPRWWGEMFGLSAARRFQISFTDLEIAVMPLKGQDTFIGLAQPTSRDTSSARFLERYGEGISLIIFEIEHSLAVDAKLKEQGVRYTNSGETARCRNQGFNSIWLHPSGMKGAFIQLSQVQDSHNP